MADDTPKTPQPGGIRPISIKPVAIKPAASAAPAAAAPAAPAPAPAAPAAGAAPQPTIRLKPIVPRPFSPGAKPAAPAAPAAAPAPAPAAPAAPAAAAPAPAPAAPAAPAPAAADPAPAAPAPADPAVAPTIRLKPVAPAMRPAAVTANLKAPEPAAPAAAPAPAEAPASPRPLAPTPASAEMKSEQLQAAKSKTSRISLDAALTAGDPAPGGPRTIRIKRPATEAPVGKLTSHIPAQPASADGEDSTPMGQRRTIRVKRPASGPAAGPAPEGPAGDEQPKEETVTPPEFATDVPPAAFSFNAAPVEKTSPIFPILGLLAVAALGVAIFYLVIGDASIFNGALWPTPR